MTSPFVIRLIYVGMCCLLLSVVCISVAPAYAIGNRPSSEEAVTPAPGQQQEVDILGKIANKYKEKADSWGNGLVQFAKRIFAAFLTIDIIVFAISGGFGIANGGKTLASVFGEFVLCVILPAAFMYSVITYYQPWSQEIIEGLKFIGSKVEPFANIGEGSFFTAGIQLFDGIYASVKLKDPATWALILVGIVILICYALMAMQILMIKCESYIVLNAGIIILGLGAFSQTRSYAINFMRYVLAVAIKLYVLQLIIGIAFSFVDDFLKTPIDMPNLTVVMGASIVMLGLIRSIPDICSGIIHGQHTSSGNALSGAMSAAGGAAMGAVAGTASMAMGAAGISGALKAASGAADAAGKTGLGKAGFMAGMMGKAAGEALLGDKASPERSMTGRFASKLNTRAMNSQMSNDTKKGGE